MTHRERERITRTMMRKLAIEVMVMIAIGMVLAFIGPFGSFEMPLGSRLAYWIALVLIGFPLFRSSSTVADWLSEATHMPSALSKLVAIAIASVPMTAIVAAFFFNLTPGHLVNWNGVGLLYFQVWLIASVITGLTHLLFRNGDEGRESAPPVSEPSFPPTPEPPLLLDLPPGFGPVHALGSEDHYVRVYGEKRSELLLMRLRDAMALMPDESGFQVHRSWWVARDAIAQVNRDGRAMSLTLQDGTTVPVSRDNMDQVKAAALEARS